MTLTLRPYQARGVEAVREAMRRCKRILLVAPTAYGKTTVSSEIIRRTVDRGKRVLFLVHRREIVKDTARRLRAADVPCGLLLAGVQTVGTPPVMVASIQTVVAREATPPADLVIWDEAHHAVAATYRQVAAIYPQAYHLGLTATPERSDGVGLRDAFDELIVGATIPELQAAGWLAECDVLSPTDLVAGIAMTPRDAWLAYGAGRPTVVFCRDVAQSREFVATMGDLARHIDGETPLALRDTTLAAFARGEFPILSNVYVLTEGWDAPVAKVCILACGIGTAGPYLQRVGRVLRRHGDERALVIDLGGVIHKHGLPDEPREFSLDGIRRCVPEKRPWIAQCLSCGFTVLGVKRGEVCRMCGAPWPVRDPLDVTGDGLVDARTVRPVFTHEEKKREYYRLKAVADRRGFKKGWVAHAYREKFGVWPRGME